MNVVRTYTQGERNSYKNQNTEFERAVRSPNSSYLSDHFSGYGGLTDSRLASPFDPVDGGRFLVGAVVPTDSYNLQLWEVLLQSAQSLLCTLQAQIQTGFTCLTLFFSVIMCNIKTNNCQNLVNEFDC